MFDEFKYDSKRQKTEASLDDIPFHLKNKDYVVVIGEHSDTCLSIIVATHAGDVHYEHHGTKDTISAMLHRFCQKADRDSIPEIVAEQNVGSIAPDINIKTESMIHIGNAHLKRDYLTELYKVMFGERPGSGTRVQILTACFVQGRFRGWW
jgi:hypothetical protein